MVIVEITILALAFCIIHHVSVRTFACHFVSSEYVIASIAHSFCIMLGISVFTPCYGLLFSFSFVFICFLFFLLFNRFRFVIQLFFCILNVLLKLFFVILKLYLFIAWTALIIFKFRKLLFFNVKVTKWERCAYFAIHSNWLNVLLKVILISEDRWKSFMVIFQYLWIDAFVIKEIDVLL